MSRCRIFTLLLLPAVVPLAARAQAQTDEPLPRYNVEIVVFANNDIDPSEERFDREAAALPAGAAGYDALIAVEPFGPASASTDPFGTEAVPSPEFGDRGARFPLPAPSPDATAPGGPATSPEPAGSGGPLEFLYPFGIPPAGPEPDVGPSIARGPDPASGARGAPGVPATDADAATGSDVVAADAAITGPQTGGATIPTAAPEPPPAFRVLRPDELVLDDAAAIVRRLGAYRLLGHGGWQQDGLPEGAAVAFNIARLGIPNPSGAISLYLGRFLHVRVDLDYRGAWPAIVPGGDTGSGSLAGAYKALEPVPLPEHFRLDDERNGIRSGELHYIDHPRFGLLLIVTPAPEPEAPAEEADALPSA